MVPDSRRDCSFCRGRAAAGTADRSPRARRPPRVRHVYNLIKGAELLIFPQISHKYANGPPRFRAAIRVHGFSVSRNEHLFKVRTLNGFRCNGYQSSALAEGRVFEPSADGFSVHTENARNLRCRRFRAGCVRLGNILSCCVPFPFARFPDITGSFECIVDVVPSWCIQ
jgi:hypothetical protein